MKNKIFMYLFFFALLFILFQYVNSKKYFDSQLVRMENIISERDSLKKQTKVLQDSTQSLMYKYLDLQYFSLENNDNAQSYYDHLDIENLSLFISDKLIETNEAKGDNPLVPYAGMNGGHMKINKIKLLNHKWILADFSDGKHWGELLFKYELKDDLSIDFTLVEHLIYIEKEY